MIIVILCLIAIIILFSLDKFPPDSAVLLAIIILVLSGVLTPEEAFLGFGSDFIIVLASIFVISSALQHNGVIEFISTRLADTNVSGYRLLVSLVMLPVGILSAFMNNTAVAAVSVLPVMSLAEKIKIAPSKLLMPMAFASLLGGTCTLIGTSTNIAGNNFLNANGLKPLGMFEFLPIGLALLLICTVFFVLFGKKVLPEGVGIANERVPERRFYSHFWVPGETVPNILNASELAKEGLSFAKVLRSDARVSYDENCEFFEGDQVFIYGDGRTLNTFFHKYKFKKTVSVPHETKLAQIMVLPSSFVANSSLQETSFYESTGLRVTGLFRKSLSQLVPHKKVKIKAGDILLVEGTAESIQQIRVNEDFIILNDSKKMDLPHLRRGFIALAIFGIAVALSSIDVLPMSIAFLGAALSIVSFKIIPTKVVYSKIDWRLIILIGGMTAFGTAIKKTGADSFLAGLITSHLTAAPPLLICLAFMIITVLLTQPMSNAAAALVVLPIGLQTAQELQLDPRSFSIAIILSASISMVTPFEPASLLVLNPGGYRISDFFRIGGPLTLLCLIVVLFLVNRIYGF